MSVLKWISEKLKAKGNINQKMKGTNNIQAGGSIRISGINVTGVLDQIDNLIAKKVISKQGYRIEYFSIVQSNGSKYFITLIKDRSSLRDQFESKKEMVDWLNKNGFKIYTKNKS